MTCHCIGGNPCPCAMRGWMGRITFGPEGAAAAPAYMPSKETLELQTLLEKARTHVMTPKEIYEQKVSWLIGMTGKLSDPMPTREQVVKALEVMGIVDPEPTSQFSHAPYSSK